MPKNDEMMDAVRQILESTRDVFIHDHGAFTNECLPDCGWYIATKKAALDKAFETEIEAEIVGGEDGN